MKKLKIIGIICVSLILFVLNNKLAQGSGYLLQIEEPDLNYKSEPLALTDSNRRLLEELIQGEAGGEGYIGAALVAQCIRDHLVRDGHSDIKRVREDHKFEANFGKVPNMKVKNAVKFIFDEGGAAVQHRVLYFYAPKVYFSESRGKDVTDAGTYPFHENASRAEYLMTYKGQKFYDELATSGTKSYSREQQRKGYNIIIHSESYAWDKESLVSLEKGQITSQFDTVLVGNNTSNVNSSEGSSMNWVDLLWGSNNSGGLGNYLYVTEGMGGLSLEERLQVERYQKDIDSNKNMFVTYTRVGFMLFGILIIVHSLALLLGYWFDRYNIFFEFSALGLLSLNRYILSPDEQNVVNTTINGARVITLKSILIIITRNSIIGAIILSGSYFRFVSFLIDLIP